MPLGIACETASESVSVQGSMLLGSQARTLSRVVGVCKIVTLLLRV